MQGYLQRHAPITVTTALINKTSLSKFIYISSIVPHSGDFAKSFNYKYFINVGNAFYGATVKAGGLRWAKQANIVRPYPYFYELQKNSHKIENVEVQKSGVSDFCKTKKFDERDVNFTQGLRAEIRQLPSKKRPHLGDVLVLFFCSEWCEGYACFVEDSYLAIVEPVISCIERFFNGV